VPGGYGRREGGSLAALKLLVINIYKTLMYVCDARVQKEERPEVGVEVGAGRLSNSLTDSM